MTIRNPKPGTRTPNPASLKSALTRAGCICLLAAAALAGGCGNGSKALVMRDAADFNNTIGSDKPVLMMFFKGGCASCAALEPTIDKLAGEYEGRAVVAKLMVLEFTFTYPSPEVHDIHDRYDIGMVPTVRLFVHGQQVKRWDSDYDINHYRQGLNEALGTPAPNPK